MARELLILRHAKSDWKTSAANDFDRPLARRGERDAPRVGKFLVAQGLIPDHVVSSPAVRAKQTVMAVCEQMDFDTDQIDLDPRIYHARAGTLIDVLNEVPPEAQRVLIAGHNPGLEILLQNLCNHTLPKQEDYKLLPTAAVAHLDILSQWNALEVRMARLLSLTRSRSLQD